MVKHKYIKDKKRSQLKDESQVIEKKCEEKPLSNRGWEVNNWLNRIILQLVGKLKR
jgi:hypothetical protein